MLGTSDRVCKTAESDELKPGLNVAHQAATRDGGLATVEALDHLLLLTTKT
jgi:hypothetical protein